MSNSLEIYNAKELARISRQTTEIQKLKNYIIGDLVDIVKEYFGNGSYSIEDFIAVLKSQDKIKIFNPIKFDRNVFETVNGVDYVNSCDINDYLYLALTDNYCFANVKNFGSRLNQSVVSYEKISPENVLSVSVSDTGVFMTIILKKNIRVIINESKQIKNEWRMIRTHVYVSAIFVMGTHPEDVWYKNKNQLMNVLEVIFPKEVEIYRPSMEKYRNTIFKFY
jgi:hypothetical protein